MPGEELSGTCRRFQSTSINCLYSCQALFLSFSHTSVRHEVGHNFGCEHDRLNASPGKPFQYGWQDPEADFRTIMAYGCPGKYCPRINYFSNPSKRYNGKIMGNASNDCTRQHNETRERIALYRKARLTNSPTASPAPSSSSQPSGAPTAFPTSSPTVSRYVSLHICYLSRLHELVALNRSLIIFRSPSLMPSLSVAPSSPFSEYPTFNIADLDDFENIESPRTTSFQVQHGIMFNIEAKDYDVTINNFRIPFFRAGDVTISIWSTEGDFWYEKNNPVAWDLLGSPKAYSWGITLENPVPLPLRGGTQYG